MEYIMSRYLLRIRCAGVERHGSHKRGWALWALERRDVVVSLARRLCGAHPLSSQSPERLV